MRPLGWRRYQVARRWLIHLRDVSVCLAAILAWGVLLLLVA